jgi:hypothetical protein
MSMFLFSTQLFINGLPVDYGISKEDDQFTFEPIFNPHFDLEVPEFKVKHQVGNLIFVDLEDENVKLQAEEILNEYLANK